MTIIPTTTKKLPTSSQLMAVSHDLCKMSHQHFSRPTIASFARLHVRLLQTEHLADDVEETGLLGVVVVDEVHQVVVVKDVLNDALGCCAVIVQLSPLLSPQLKRLVLTQTQQSVITIKYLTCYFNFISCISTCIKF